MDSKIKVGAVSYLNAKPLIYGLEHSDIKKDINFIIDYPSVLADKLISGQIDIGLVPVAAIPHLSHPHIVSDYCISAHQKVKSVCIFSEVPMEEVTHLYLDYQSKTSVALAQLLMDRYWKQDVTYLPADEDFICKIKGPAAGVIIGDRALYHLSHFQYVYDLSEFWYKLTGLDFVFAAWISNKSISSDFIQQFNQANQLGVDIREEIAQSHYVDYYDLKKYYTEDILYKFDDNKVRGLKTFMEYLSPGTRLNFL